MDPYRKNADNHEVARRKRERASEDLRGLVDRIIDDAQSKGAFENLPGRGKPLQLDENNPFEGNRRLAYKLLKDNNYTLPWIANRNDQLDKIEAFRERLQQAWQRATQNYRRAPSEIHRMAQRLAWTKELEPFQLEIVKLNKAIASLNLTVPVTSLEIVKLNLDAELRRIGSGRELGAGQ